MDRRQLLLGSAAALATTRLARAETGAEKPTIVLFYLRGGYNAFFSAADGYLSKNLYQCRADNVRDLGNDLVVDASTIGSMPASVLDHMATAGVLHRASGHDFAQRFAWFDGGVSVPLKLAEALGGNGPFRCVNFGPTPGGIPHRPVGGIPMTAVPDLAAVVTLCSSGGGADGPRRDLMARALGTSLDYSAPRFQRSPSSLSHSWNGAHTLISALSRPPPPDIDWSEISAAYQIPPGDLSARSISSMLAGAEIMVRAGADVVCVTSTEVKTADYREDWDTHGDTTGELSRRMMRDAVIGPLSTFLQRTLGMAGRNVITLLWGDFARIGGDGRGESGHANGVSASVFGKYVQPGTTGRFTTGPVPSDAFYVLPEETPSYPGLWSYLSALARVPRSPWGPNPHGRITKVA
ncbi:MAG: hypothetical protein U1E65_08705 [Myxococcota bacterium]